MIVWSFDPGETTGVFMTNGHTHHHYQLEHPRVFSKTHVMFEEYAVDLVIVERVNIFDSRASRARKNLQPTLDVQGYVTGLTHRYGVPLVLQWNRDKNKVGDDELASRDMMAKPKTKWRHANDAARHYVYWANRKKEA